MPVPTLERVTFIELNLPDILPTPPATLADYLPEHADELHRRIEDGVQFPLGRLVVAGEELMRSEEGRFVGSIDSNAIKEIVTQSRPMINRVEARYLLSDTYRHFNFMLRTIGKVGRWRPERIEQAERTMAGELLIPRNIDGWAWWLGQAATLESRKSGTGR